jgi:hypothetical protein
VSQCEVRGRRVGWHCVFGPGFEIAGLEGTDSRKYYRSKSAELWLSNYTNKGYCNPVKTKIKLSYI